MNNKIAGIQYLRAFAALSVVWLHALAKIPGTIGFLGHSYFGGAGVDLFFVISGFIMVVTTMNREITPGQFFTMRVIRVVPLYWLVTAAAIAIAPLGHEGKGMHVDAEVILKSLAFIPYDSPDFPGHLWPIMVQGWTLNFEMFFYLLFALSLALGRWRLVALTGALAALVALGAILNPPPTSDVVIYTSPMLLEFALGMTIARIMAGKRAAPLWLSLAIIPAGVLMLGAHHSRFVLAVGASLAVIGAMHPAISKRPIKLPMMLGDASYSIYLIHPFILAALAMIWSHRVGTPSMASSAAYMAVAIALTAVSGWVCFLYVETPMTRRLRGWVKRPATGATLDQHP